MGQTGFGGGVGMTYTENTPPGSPLKSPTKNRMQTMDSFNSAGQVPFFAGSAPGSRGQGDSEDSEGKNMSEIQKKIK